MMLYRLENVSLVFGEKVLLQKANLVINKGDKIGIIGNNGQGKSSLLKALLKKIDFSGEIISNVSDVGYLSQDENFKENKLLQKRKKEIENLLVKEDIISDSIRYQKLLEEYNSLITSNSITSEKHLLDQFNFNEELFSKEKKENLSGGETTKYKLIKILLNPYDILLLDEPTNHLDKNSRDALIKYLNTEDSYIIVSHDVDLLNKCVNKIIEIKNSQLYEYTGNYDDYLKEKEKEKNEILKTQTEHKKEKKIIENNMSRLKSWGNDKLKQKTKHLKKGQVIANLGTDKGSVESGIADTSKKLNKMQDKLENIDTPEIEKEENIKIKYLDFQKPNKETIKVENLSKHFEDFSLQIQNFLLMNDEKVALQGKNGSGKSTLLKLISNDIKPDQGNIKIGNKVKLGYLSQKNETINLENTVLNEILSLNINLDEGEIRTYLGKFLFKKNSVFRKIRDLSGGEKIRLGILKLILSGCNVLLLDEPSNHLDIQSKEILSEALKEFPGAILVVSHDDFFLKKFITKKIYLEKGEII